MQRTIGAWVLLAIIGGAALSGCGDDAASDDAGSTTTTAGGDDFLAQVDALCAELDQSFATDIESALSETRDLASQVQTTEPAALDPVYTAAETGFGEAADVVAQVHDEFAALDAPADAEATITEVEDALVTVQQMLTDVQEAAAAKDLAAFGTAVAALNDLDQAQPDAAANELNALGATECRPAGG